MRLLRFCVSMVCAAIFLSGGAFAHKQKIATTEILINDRSGFIEVSHRFVLHDAEDAIIAQTGQAGDLIANEDDRMAFADYVAETFGLQTFGFAPRHLTLLGAEVAEGNLFVYQEMPIGAYPGIMLITHQTMMDIWPQQTNAVIIKQGPKVRTVTFRRNDPQQLILFKASQ